MAAACPLLHCLGVDGPVNARRVWKPMQGVLGPILFIVIVCCLKMLEGNVSPSQCAEAVNGASLATSRCVWRMEVPTCCFILSSALETCSDIVGCYIWMKYGDLSVNHCSDRLLRIIVHLS